MKFGPLPVRDARGATLVHGQTLGGHRYRKGHVLEADDIARLEEAGVERVTVALFEEGDVDENTAARRLAEAAAGPGVRTGTEGTGRVNLFAAHAGLAQLDPDAVNRVNAIDEGITIATLNPLDRVDEEQVVATVKIIPFAVSREALARAESAAQEGDGLVAVRPYRPRDIALVQTDLPGLKASVAEKTETVIRQRVEAMGSRLRDTRMVDHDADSLARALDDTIAGGSDLVLIVGASATVDRKDVIPAGISNAGGEIDHYGMPVDPGNLLVLAHIGHVPVLALPGSARSPRPGGNDIVLERILADIPVDGAQIMAMGVGGLMKEIPSRPLPRRTAAPRRPRHSEEDARFACLVLAAGRSRRMGDVNKLLIGVDGKPMARHAIDAALDAGCNPVIVVTGHAADDVQAALGEDVTYVHNPDYAEGLSTSLRAGVTALPENCDGAVVALGDMPRITAEHMRSLMQAHDTDEGHLICVPTWKGKRGNPVLWDRRFFDDMTDLGGDVGAKHLIGTNEDLVIEVPLDDDAIVTDVDSPDALERLAERGARIEK
ncbi:MAG: molybdopterin-binding/glycosyltransferase family 2 protein [Alphaproteobacteria bacterium]|nr:molybdopterin-binding/glycosyltransferase family 2 protein [Alphaproteobacteria bacterium]